jgi:hypothetical protein
MRVGEPSDINHAKPGERRGSTANGQHIRTFKMNWYEYKALKN